MTVIERYPIVWRNSKTGTYSNLVKAEPPTYITVTMRYGNETKSAICRKYRFYKHDELMSQDVNILCLGTRGENALKRHGIKTLGQLAERMDAIPKMKGVGVTCLTEINDTLRAVYMRWMREHHPEQLEDIDNVEYGDGNE